MNLDQQRLCIELQHVDWARELKEEVIGPSTSRCRLPLPLAAISPGSNTVFG